MQESRKFQIQ